MTSFTVCRTYAIDIKSTVLRKQKINDKAWLYAPTTTTIQFSRTAASCVLSASLPAIQFLFPRRARQVSVITALAPMSASVKPARVARLCPCPSANEKY